MERQYEMKDIFFELMDYQIQGVDTYFYKGSRWLIFTDDKKWVIELTKDGTLWYNYYFFEKAMKLISLGVVGNQHYITEWVENTIQNGVKYTDACQIGTSTSIEDAIRNGVKKTNPQTIITTVEDTIQNGVKETFLVEGRRIGIVKNAIQNGVKETKHNLWDGGLAMEEAIQNGVKHTEYGDWLDGDERLDDIIENGVKETKMEEHHRLREVVQTVKNGIKETTPGGYLGSVEMKGKKVHQFESPKQNNEVEDVIENGVKESKHSLWDGGLAMEEAIQNGVKEIKGIGDSSLSSEIFKVKCKQTIREGVKKTEMEEHHRLREVVQTVNDGIKNTVNHPARPQEVVDNIINNGIKQTESIASHRTWKSAEVIENGIKETNPHFLEILNPMNFEPPIKEMKRMNEVNVVLENGIKETKTPNDRNFVDTFDFLDYNGSNSVPNIIEQVIQNGIKDTKELPDQSGELNGYGEYYVRQKNRTYPHNDIVNDVIRDGIKETKYCELHSLMRADHIIRDGIKETSLNISQK